ncbi:purple acid phosphatase [Microbacterium phage ArMaWen]|uniref:Purple acid phosphatase n=1 Tax=Microbacterium phage ArMaWen TaxID=2500786 RepID=A0A3T0IP14_9CAUD|nr:purple acid phosphatase [Microbacterium phage ArMaWen]
MGSPLLGSTHSATGQPNAGTLTIVPEATTKAGDLVIVAVCSSDTAGPTWVMSGGTGSWTTHVSTSSIGTLRFYVFSKIRHTDDTTYTLTRTGADGWRVATVTIPDWNGVAPIVGAVGTRAASGGAFVTTAPSITTVTDKTLALYIAAERTIANDNEPVPNNGFTTFYDGHTVGSDNLNALYIATKRVSPAGAVGATSATFTNSHASNSAAVLLGVVSPDTPPLPTIGARLATNPTDTSVTVGVDVANGTHVQAYLYQGASLVTMKEFDVDAISGWGHTTFTNLSPDTGYTVQFVVDGNELVSQALSVRTLPEATGAASFVMVTGSCQFTGSNHPVFDAILADQPRVFAHMGDLHYADATTAAAWRAGVETSLVAPRMKNLLGQIPMTWTWDNHDRIITNNGGAGTALNLGTTDPATNTEARKLFGSDGMGTEDSFGRAWWMGRVLFIQTDQWTNKNDPDNGVEEYKSFLGTAQREWFKDTLELLGGGAAAIVWLCQWTGQNHANGRWNSFPDETAELEQFFNFNSWLKEKLVMIGGDSHSLQVTDGTRTAAQGQRFEGVPNFNISGFNRSSDAGQGGAGWLVDLPLRTSAQLEADWGGYSRITVEDDGLVLTMTWEGVRVNSAGATDVMDTRTLTFGELPPEPTQPFDKVYVGSGLADKVYVGNTQVWP